LGLITILAFLLILSLLVFVHELGHFIVAKRSGITVEEFAIGFPPRAVKLWQEEGSITLDGHEYVIGRKVKVPRFLQPGNYIYADTAIDKKGRPVVTNIEIVESEERQIDQAQQAGSEAKFFGMLGRNSKAAPAAGRPVVKVEALTKPTEYSFNWIPFGGYVRMLGEEDPTAPGSFASKSKKVRFAVLVAGSGMNLIAAIFFFMFTAMSGVPEPITGINLAGEEAPLAQTIITEVVPDTPAEAAGLAVNDVVVGANEVEFNHIGDLVTYVDQHKGSEITLQLEREGQMLSTSLVPRVNPPEGQGSMGVGITYDGMENDIVYYPPHEAFLKGMAQTGQYVGLTFYMPIAILRNIFPAEAARPTGPVGIYQQTDSAVEAAISLNWWFPVLWLTAVLSTALAVTNLLPLPALDGGRILFIIIEAIRGKRVSPEKEGAIHFIGLAVLLTLMIVISYYDVSNPLPTIDWSSLF
jgi:regulator of sigma E protease